MSTGIKDAIQATADFAAILTAIIAVIFFFKTLKKNYYLNDIPGNYKIFSGLKNKEGATVLNQIKISYVSRKGWFFGYLKYSEIFEDPHARNGGGASVFGKINYSYLRMLIAVILRFIKLKRYNPLETNDSGSFHGKIYFLSRNDLDVTKNDWREMIVQEYSIIHYTDAHRFKLHSPKKSKTYLQLPDELVLINVDKVPDQLYNLEIEF